VKTRTGKIIPLFPALRSTDGDSREKWVKTLASSIGRFLKPTCFVFVRFFGFLSFSFFWFLE
jgi:hypothetical protein